MIEVLSKSIFHLSTDNTSYIIRILETGHAEHIYYGKRLHNAALAVSGMSEKRYARAGMGTYTDRDFTTLVLDDAKLEFSAEGRGDYRTPLIAVSIGKDGERTLDLKYAGNTVSKGTMKIKGLPLPQAKDPYNKAETLCLNFIDATRHVELILVYTVFPSTDTITRRSYIRNNSEDRVTVRAIASSQLDFRETGMSIITLNGTWGREFEKRTTVLNTGTFISESRRLTSSAEANPGFILSRNDGSAYAMNLIYSGPHRTSISVTEHGMTHLVWGINPDMFSWVLESKEGFETPEAVMTFSEKGIEDAGDRIKRFITTSVLRSSWKERMRPLMLDTWEAVRYSVKENKLEEMAKAAEAMGCEGILLNDGWFGARNNDRTSLGDWHVNTQKMPSGLTELADSIHRRGLLFGLWFEPEAISTKSMIYKAHPEWIIGRDGETNAEGRHEELLDLTRFDVQDWIVTTIVRLANLVRLDFLRWDMNRHYSDLYTLTGIRDYGMYAHEYTSALYKILSDIGERCPDMYIETTAGGGARFDLGMLSVSASIIPSCVSDPIERARMMASASLMYPQTVIGTVVSPSPNWATRRIVDRETRFNIAIFGVLSYSMDPTTFSGSEMKAFKEQIEFYKAFRLFLETGRFRVIEDSNRLIWSVSDEDRSTILVLYLQKAIRPNTTAEVLRVPDANESYNYRVFSRSHILPEREVYAYPEESECYEIPGDALKWGGISMVEQISGIGHHEGMRMLGDYSSRLYIIRRIEK